MSFKVAIDPSIKTGIAVFIKTADIAVSIEQKVIIHAYKGLKLYEGSNEYREEAEAKEELDK